MILTLWPFKLWNGFLAAFSGAEVGDHKSICEKTVPAATTSTFSRDEIILAEYLITINEYFLLIILCNTFHWNLIVIEI